MKAKEDKNAENNIEKADSFEPAFLCFRNLDYLE